RCRSANRVRSRVESKYALNLGLYSAGSCDTNYGENPKGATLNVTTPNTLTVNAFVAVPITALATLLPSKTVHI
ncbi:unnamed protein product, partial [marine sediment metagenome]